ncbi:MAG: hypothetical protein JWN49_646 [Parcubacteria group bacterium]|nr:hypothetical protein [Parcubacteria group bacterium]
MDKDFDLWNVQKKHIDTSKVRRFYRTREVWWLWLGVNIGHEQDGTSKNFQRPVLILRAFSRFSCLIVPLTSSQKENPYHIKIGIIEDKEAAVIISQIRLIDTQRLVGKVCDLNSKTFEDVKKAVRAML